jgi:hypothetical protein
MRMQTKRRWRFILATVCLGFWSGCNEVPTRDEGTAATSASKPVMESARAPAVKQTDSEIVATDQNSRRWSGETGSSERGRESYSSSGVGRGNGFDENDSRPPARSKGTAKPLRRDTIPNAADIGL